MEDVNYFEELVNRGKELHNNPAFPLTTMPLGKQIIDKRIFFLIKVFSY